MDDIHGAWMYDTVPRSERVAEKLWVTRINNTSFIYEYNRREDYSPMNFGKEIRLDPPFAVSLMFLFVKLILYRSVGYTIQYFLIARKYFLSQENILD